MTTPEATSGAGERRRLTTLVMAFGTALGVTAFAYPLLALDVGLSASTVGLLAAVSAAVQMLSRLVLPALLARVTDRRLMIVALLALSASAITLLFTQMLIGFVAAQSFQGMARGIFHTASQTHAVRDTGVGSRRLAFVQTTAQFGRLLGPAIGGLLALVSLQASLWMAVALAGAAAVFGLTLLALPPYARLSTSERTPIWRRPDLRTACWGGATGGVWRGLSESFVPVLLSNRGLSVSLIGWMLSGADAAGFLTTASVAKWGREDVRGFVPLSATALAAALALLPVLAGNVPLGIAMLVAGSAGGVAGVLGTAVASDSVEQEEQGAAITLVGTYRAGTRLIAPAGVSGLLLVVALPVAIGIVAGAIFAPVAWLASGTKRPVGEKL